LGRKNQEKNYQSRGMIANAIVAAITYGNYGIIAIWTQEQERLSLSSQQAQRTATHLNAVKSDERGCQARLGLELAVPYENSGGRPGARVKH
jgi:hypothetical protein